MFLLPNLILYFFHFSLLNFVIVMFVLKDGQNFMDKIEMKIYISQRQKNLFQH
jgi:hypothetical protein